MKELDTGKSHKAADYCLLITGYCLLNTGYCLLVVKATEKAGYRN